MTTLMIISKTKNTGKTAIASGLLRNFIDKKIDIGKIITTKQSSSSDIDFYRNFFPEAENIHLNDSSKINIESLLKNQTINIIEGSEDHEKNLKDAQALDASILLVVKYGENFQKILDHYGSRINGFVINFMPKYRTKELQDYIDKNTKNSQAEFFGIIPDDRKLLSLTIEQLASILNGEFICGEEYSSKLIENYLIGGLVLDWGPFYFSSKKNNAVIVRGDRPDVQLSALQTNETQALLLTKGVAPVEYISYEAEKVNKPIILFDDNTHEFTEKVEKIQLKSSINHPEKIDRISDLISDKLDLNLLIEKLKLPVTR
ncbi:MAG: hypothetical protein CL748_01550 [Chloroflexi bacterium]|nr:hypothetical protein [Chloroflexota bacterium]